MYFYVLEYGMNWNTKKRIMYYLQCGCCSKKNTIKEDEIESVITCTNINVSVTNDSFSDSMQNSFFENNSFNEEFAQTIVRNPIVGINEAKIHEIVEV